MTVNCTKCTEPIEDGDLRANYPTGVLCVTCGDKYIEDNNLEGAKAVDVHAHFARQLQLAKSDEIKVGGYEIPKSLLNAYADKVSYTRRAGIYSAGSDDPLIVEKALRGRVKAHQAIFKYLGLKYPDYDNPYDKRDAKSTKFQEALSKWLEELAGMKAVDFGVKID